MLVYYDTQRDTSDGGHERFRDSWLTDPKGNQLSTEWSGVYSLTCSVVATLQDSFGKAMLEVVDRYIEEIETDGLYWDEMEGRATARRWSPTTSPTATRAFLTPRLTRSTARSA